MKPFTVLIVATLQAISATAMADIYKCKDANGRTTFSQLPCAPDAQKVIVKTTEPSESDREQTRETLDKNNAMIKENEESRQIASARNRVDTLINEREAKLSQLRIKKLYAANNLAGATWEKSISDEMQAVTEKYNADIDAARQRVHDLENKKK